MTLSIPLRLGGRFKSFLGDVDVGFDIKEGEVLQIGDDIRIHVKRIKRQVRLCIDAPRNVELRRLSATEVEEGTRTTVTDKAEDKRLDVFDYHLPDGLVASYPPDTRDIGRLLLRQDDVWRDRMIRDLDQVFSPGDLLVVNDTKVLAARLFGCRATGGRVKSRFGGLGYKPRP